MRILITLKGGASSIEGEAPFETLEKVLEVLNNDKECMFIDIDKTAYGGKVLVNKTAIAYITRKQ